jgi:predicted nucleotidyltransferase
MNSLGEKIRKLREEKKLPLRSVAAFLDIDQAVLSKIERGLLKARREQVIKLAEYYKIDENDLLVSWLSDKLVVDLADEEVALKALQVAEEKIGYKTLAKKGLSALISTIKKVLKSDGRVDAAWLFGSTALNDAKPESDLDLIIEFNQKKKYSMFDLLDIAHAIEVKIDRKVDLVEKGQSRDFAIKTSSKSLQKIYG